MHFKVIVAIAVVCIVCTGYVRASSLKIDIPENANIAWISNDLNQNGMLLSIRTFNSPDPVDAVLEFYRKAWHTEGEMVGFIESVMSDWKIISQLHHSENVVLQLKSADQGGSTGFLSVAKLNANSQSVENDLPVPEDTNEFSSTFIKENDTEVHTIVYITKQSVGATTKFYRDQMTSKGWSIARSMEMNGSNIVLFNKRENRCEMVIQRLNENDTVIYINRVKRSV